MNWASNYISHVVYEEKNSSRRANDFFGCRGCMPPPQVCHPASHVVKMVRVSKPFVGDVLYVRCISRSMKHGREWEWGMGEMTQVVQPRMMREDAHDDEERGFLMHGVRVLYFVILGVEAILPTLVYDVLHTNYFLLFRLYILCIGSLQI